MPVWLFSALLIEPIAVPRYQLQWSAPPTCPRSEEAARSIEAKLPAPPEGGTSSPPLRAAVTITGEPGAYRLVLIIDDQGRRELRADDCEALTQSVALIVAIAVDERASVDHASSGPPATIPPTQAVPDAPPTGAVPDAPPNTERPPPAPSTAPNPVRADDAAVVATRRPRPTLRAELAATAGASVALLPSAAGAFAIDVGLRAGPFRADATAMASTPSSGTVADHPEAGGRFVLWALGVRLCGIAGLRKVEFPICAGVHAGMVHGRGQGEVVARSAGSPWVAIAAGPQLVYWPRPRVGLQLGVDVVAIVARPRLDIDGLGTACCTNPVGGLFVAGARFGVP